MPWAPRCCSKRSSVAVQYENTRLLSSSSQLDARRLTARRTYLFEPCSILFSRFITALTFAETPSNIPVSETLSRERTLRLPVVSPNPNVDSETEACELGIRGSSLPHSEHNVSSLTSSNLSSSAPLQNSQPCSSSRLGPVSRAEFVATNVTEAP